MQSRARIRTALLALVAIGCLSLSSCGPSGPILYPVTGKVLFEDQPAAGATVVFHLIGGAPSDHKPAGTVQADGRFTVNTYPHGAGAPPGEYAVLVTWFEPSKNENSDAKSKIPAWYADPQKSGLKATIIAGTNTLEPFVLTKKAR